MIKSEYFKLLAKPEPVVNPDIETSKSKNEVETSPREGKKSVEQDQEQLRKFAQTLVQKRLELV